MDQLPRSEKRELISLLLATCNYVVSVWRGFLFLWVLGMGYVILLWHSLSLPYNCFIFLTEFMHYMYVTNCASSWLIAMLHVLVAMAVVQASDSMTAST